MLDEAFDCPIISEADINWLELDHGTMVPSSYHQESTGLHPLSFANQPLNRETLVQSAINNHAIVNPMEDIPGLGELAFLSDADRVEALRRGYATPHDVSMARRRGDLAVGTGINAGPIVVFWPNSETLNPAEDPQGPGAWRFLTSDGETSNAGLAAIQFGGSRGLPAYPSARHIRQLGQFFIQEGVTNLAAQIDLVWVPGAEDVEDEVDLTLDNADLQEDEEEEEEEEEEELVESPASDARPAQASPRHNPEGLLVDPTNNDGVRGGEHDQTGQRADYQTMARHGGRVVTIDRSRAWFDHPEPHKLWCYSHRGWRKWIHWASMDWKSKAQVNKLNKYREQTHKRAEWPRLREVKREDYSLAERQFIMDAIKAADGERSKIDMAKLTPEFYLHFPHRARNETGLQSLVDRIRKELKNHGDLVHRNPRGWSQKLLSKATQSDQGGKSKDRVDSDEPGEAEEGEAEDDVEAEDDGDTEEHGGSEEHGEGEDGEEGEEV
jgi:hypothetical protein